jgi:hypothetical protein
MAVTNEQIVDFLLDNPGISDAEIVAAMEEYGVSPSQMAEAVGLDEGEVVSRVAETVPEGQSITLGDTIVQPQYQVIGSGEDRQVGGLENVYTYKVGENKTGGGYNQYNPDGTLARTGTQQEVKSGLKEFALGSALLFGGLGGGFDSLFGGPAAGNGAFLGEGVASGIPSFDAAFLNAGGTFNPAFGLPVGNGAFLGEGVPTGIPASDAAFLNAGGTFNPAFTLAPDGLLGTPIVVPPTGVPPTGVPPTGVPPTGVPPTGVPPTGVPPTGVPPTGVPSVVTPPTGIPPIVTPPTGIPIPTVADITRLAQTGLTAAQIAQLLSTGATTAAGLLQQQTSREAAQKAQAMIDAETAAAKQAAQFRPIGMTTRFGASQFGFDPKTGQLTSAGYTLSPEAKAAQDRFVKLAEQGIQQAEGAQKAFEPLQTGAQSLFGLGNKYLAQSPEAVAENYLKSQMALLQPGRETELANLQNRLQQQGRGGLSVAQGGTLGATTPELQALYNARAQQEAQLAANAQQYGQQNVLFGAGLLGQGSQAMGQYYSGQQAAYAPYTTALGQVQGLETAAQQPLMLGANLGQTAAQAGFNVGQLGLRGAGASVELATGKAATTNPYSTAISGLAANPAFGQYVGGLLSPTAPVTAMSAPATTFGTGNYYGQQDLGLYL